jgi:chloramphenicol 3-O-phosphotransferase
LKESVVGRPWAVRDRAARGAAGAEFIALADVQDVDAFEAAQRLADSDEVGDGLSRVLVVTHGVADDEGVEVAGEQAGRIPGWSRR